MPAWSFGPLLPKNLFNLHMGVFSLRPLSDALLWKIIIHNYCIIIIGSLPSNPINIDNSGLHVIKAALL